MGFAILRTQKLKAAVAVRRSLAHAFRERDTPNADAERTPENSHEGASTSKEAMARFSTLLPEKRRKDAVLAIEYLVTASPEDMRGKTRQQQDAYFADVLTWLKARHGAENLVYAGIHRDESTPHLYAYVVPLDKDGRLNCRAFLGGAKALTEMQTSFAAEVGKRHSLERGIEGSKARHQRVKRHYAEITKPLPVVSIQAGSVEPKVLKEGFFTKTVETSAEVAKRLTAAAQRAYGPALERAATADSAAHRAREMEKTANTLSRQKKAAEEALKGLQKHVSPLVDLEKLDRSEFDQILMHAARKVEALKEAKEKARQLDELAKERQRRIDDLPRVEKMLAGTAHLFARHALDELKKVGGDASRVDWSLVEVKALGEAVVKHGQSREMAVMALVKHSPGMVDKKRQEEAMKHLPRYVRTLQPDTRESGYKPPSPGH